MFLKVKQLSVLTNSSRPLSILKEINFSLPANSILTITGKNGSGKTTLIKSLTSLLDKNNYLVTGEVYIDEHPLSQMTDELLQEIRRDKIKYIFQDSINSFNPLLKIGYYFENISGNSLETEELLDYFYLPPGKRLFKLHPYELSGGMAQRIAIVLALRARPSLLIFDEPTSSLDSPAINLLVHKLKEFISSENNSVLIVTQDLDFGYEVSSSLSLLDKGVLADPLPVQEFQAANEKSFTALNTLNSKGNE